MTSKKKSKTKKLSKAELEKRMNLVSTLVGAYVTMMILRAIENSKKEKKKTKVKT